MRVSEPRLTNGAKASSNAALDGAASSSVAAGTSAASSAGFGDRPNGRPRAAGAVEPTKASKAASAAGAISPSSSRRASWASTLSTPVSSSRHSEAVTTSPCTVACAPLNTARIKLWAAAVRVVAGCDACAPSG